LHKALAAAGVDNMLITGPGAYGRALDDLSLNISRIDEEIIELLPELSSK
jgi:hypothetical protein